MTLHGLILPQKDLQCYPTFANASSSKPSKWGKYITALSRKKCTMNFIFKKMLSKCYHMLIVSTLAKNFATRMRRRLKSNQTNIKVSPRKCEMNLSLKKIYTRLDSLFRMLTKAKDFATPNRRKLHWNQKHIKANQ